jgi:pyridoxine 5-phosphate synthase
LHTGTYARKFHSADKGRTELKRLATGARRAQTAGLLVNAGHGIDYDNAEALVAVHPFNELNIGFAIIARALFVGIRQAVAEMKEKIQIPCAAS